MKVSPAWSRISPPSLRPSASASRQRLVGQHDAVFAPPALAVRRQDFAQEGKLAVRDPRQGGDGRAAGAIQRLQKGALGRGGDGMFGDVEMGEQASGLFIAGAGGDGQRALSRRGRHRFGIHEAVACCSSPSRFRPASAR